MVSTPRSALCIMFIIWSTAAQTYRECGGELTAPTGLIMSPQYPMSYPNNAFCEWIITAPENDIIDVRIDTLDVDGSMGICSDFVDIYDGPTDHSVRLHRLCQYRSEDELARLQIRSTGNKMKIMFISDSTFPRSGFLMNYWTHECDRFKHGLDNCDQNCICSTTTSEYCNNLNGTCVCKKGWSGSDCSQDVNECVVTKVELCGDYQICVNTIGGYNCECAQGLVKNLTGQCNVADTAVCANNNTCSHVCTKIQVNDTSAHEDACLCPNNMVLNEDSCQACSKLKFGKNCQFGCNCVETKTEKCDDVTGECICLPQWTSANCGQDLNECSLSNSNCQGNNKYCINTYGGFNCTCINGYRLNSNNDCEEIARSCYYELQETNGTLMSPNYPENYYDRANCTWKISVPNITATIVFNVSDLVFELCCDYLVVSDGIVGNSYLATSSTGIFRSNSNAITVRFISDVSITARGFLANFYVSDVPGCGHVLNELSGNLEIPMYPPGTFYSCYWSIKPLFSKNIITLSLHEFDINCTDGYVDVYSTIPPRHNNFLGRYCGSAVANLIRSHSGVMYIHFYSEISDTKPRFNVSYLAHNCPYLKYGPDCTTPCTCNTSNTKMCQDSDGKCICNAGWTSIDCSEDINECLRNPCPAYTTCENSPGRYACVISRTGPSGQINCSHYDSNVNGLADYFWTITGEPNTVVSLKFLNLQLFNSFWCANGLFIYDGNHSNSRQIGRYCGSDMPKLIRTTGNVLLIILKNNYVISNCFTGDYSVHVCLPFTFGPSCTRTCRCLKERTDFCDNINGFCSCKLGWTGRDCSRDVNECRFARLYKCPVDSVCRNTPGSYECQCLKGFQMSGGQCIKNLDCPPTWRNKYCSHACYMTDKREPKCSCPKRLLLKKINEKSFICVVPFYPYGDKLDLIKAGAKHRSHQISLINQVPFGKNVASSSFYIMRDGVILFDQSDISFSPNISRAYEHKHKLIAALWSEMDTSEGNVYLNKFEKCGSLELHELQEDKIKAEVIDRAERDIKGYYNIPDFEASTVFVVSWDKVQQPKKKDKLTFQAVFISGYERHFKNGQLVLAGKEIAFALLVYQEGMLTWPKNGLVPVGVGYVNKDGYKDVIKGNSNDVNKLHRKDWIPNDGLTDKGVIIFQLGSFGGPEKSCQKYLCKQSPLLLHPMYQNEIDELYKCPCTLDRLGLQWQLFETRGDIKCYSISNIVKSRLLPHNIRNKLCCYKLPKESNDNWISQLQAASYLQNSPEGGHILISDPWASSVNSHQAKEQIHAHKTCCSQSNPEMCNRFYKIFPDKQCSNQVRFVSAFAIGDPHITTCDGFTYAMNGLGEFIMMSVPSENFTLQARTGRAETSNGTLTNATVFTAFAAREGTTTCFQVELAINNKTMVLLLNGIDKTNDFYNDREFMAVTESTIVTREKRKNSTAVKVNFACGVAIEIHVGFKNLEISLQVDNTLKNKTTGLMGNCNGNVSDDFLLPNGTLLQPNSTERQIFEHFVKQFTVTAGTTIFNYEEGEGDTNFIDEDFVPFYGDELEMEVSSAAEAFCGANNYACIFDFAVTGDLNFAKNTKSSKNENDIIVANLENQTPDVQLITGTTFYNKHWVVTKEQENILQVIAMDLDGDELSYQIDANLTNISVDKGGKITFIPTDYKLLLLQIKVKDSKGGYSSAEFVSLIYCSNCSGNGICSNMTSSVVKYKLSCDCNPAYTGEDCEVEVDACESLPCQDGRTCTDLTAAEQGNNTNGYRCGPCQIGFQDGPLESCLDIDECQDGNTCDQICINTYGSFVCACEAGYRLDNKDGITCIDLNECEERIAICQQNCENIDGSYNCFCNEGYTLNDDGNTCQLESINEDVCKSCQQVCILTQEISKCACYSGYVPNPENDTQCIDINECAQGIMPCSQNCTNTDGHFKCSCYAGYQLAEDGVTCTSCESSYFGDNCKNVCECNIHGSCDPVQGCICETGWLGDNCDEDVDECLQGDLCPAGQICENLRGTFHCVCQEGFRQENGVCIDVDECDESEFRTACNIEANEICINTQGSYTCGCRKGFARNIFSSCEDINECLIGIDDCEQICENVAGSYNCKCYPGYRKAEDRHHCVDVKELCKSYNLNCSHGCSIDNNGNPLCFCPRGYLLHGLNRCEDINECANPTKNLCTFKQGCLNIYGGHVCSCPTGQKLDNDNRTCHECDETTWGDNCANNCSCGVGSLHCDPVTGCICRTGFTGQFCSEDIDECAIGQLSCPDNEMCVNLPGSSRCQCREGYFKKNEICKDINECEDKRLHNCKQICTNSLGGFNCSCYPGYAYNNFTNTCTDINECDQNLFLCNEICTNTEGSYRCSCPSGLPLQPDGITCGVKMCHGNECPEHLECRSQKNTYECVCFNGLNPNIDLQCEDCNRRLTEKSGKIMTSFYPQNYSEDSNCSWTIELTETNAVISLTIDQFDVEGCPYDYLEIYDGPNADAQPIGQYCDVAPGTVKSTGNSMHIIFYSDSSETRNGFIGSYVADSQCKHKICSHTCQVISTKPWTEECLCFEWMKLDQLGTHCLDIHACNTTINESSGYIVSPGFPENYPDATECYWTFEAVNNSVITLSFSAFALEGGVDCPYDFLQVFEGTSNNAAQLGLYCGGEIPLNLTSTNSGMHLVFRSDNAVSSGGFKAEFFIKHSS